MEAAAAMPRSKETPLQLLESAILCFAEKGFEATTIREIADRAGKLVSLIGYHFGTKEKLYFECFQYIFHHCPMTPINSLYQDLDAIRKDQDLAAQSLRSVIQGLLRDLHAEPDDPIRDSSIKLFLPELSSPRPLLHKLFQERMGEPVRWMTACISSLQPDLPGPEVSFLGQCILGICLIHRLAPGVNALIWQSLPPSSPEAAADRIADFVLRGLGYRDQP